MKYIYIIAFFFFSACCGDTLVGLWMTVHSSKQIPSSCIVLALESVNSIKRYKKSHVPGQDQWGCSEGFHKSPSYDYYEYYFHEYNAAIQVYSNSDGTNILEFESAAFGNQMDVEEIKTRKDILRALYEEMRNTCEGLPKKEEVSVHCIQYTYTAFYTKHCEDKL